MAVWGIKSLEQNSRWLSRQRQASPLQGSLQQWLQLDRLRLPDLGLCSVPAVHLALVLWDTSIIRRFHCNGLFQATDKTSPNSLNCLQKTVPLDLPMYNLINFAAGTSRESPRQEVSPPRMLINVFKHRNWSRHCRVSWGKSSGQSEISTRRASAPISQILN